MLLSVTDAPNYRVGPQPGCPFKSLMLRSTEKDPSQGGPLYVPDAEQQRRTPGKGASECLYGWSYGERLARDLPITSYKRLKKRL